MRQTKQPPATNTDLRAGIWHSIYRYPSSSRMGLFEGEHFVRLQRSGKQWVAESLPNVNKSYLLVRLTTDEYTATGTWHEHTEPGGYYKGAIYHGVIQMVIDDDGRRMHGKWLGFSRDMAINVGAWEFVFVGKKLPADIN